MPEATVLYTVTAVVVLGLIVWVAVVLKTAREPWARPSPPRLSHADSRPPAQSDSGLEPKDEAKAAEPELEGASGIDADSTAKATPVALAS